MVNNLIDPFANLMLDVEEQSLETSLEKGDYAESSDLSKIKEMLEEAANRHQQLRTTKPITLRINQLDLIKIKAKAKRNNIPYQTLLGAVVHDFAEGQIELKIR